MRKTLLPGFAHRRWRSFRSSKHFCNPDDEMKSVFLFDSTTCEVAVKGVEG